MNRASHLKSGPYIFAFFLLGAYSIATQVLMIREFFVVFFGNELCIGIIFSTWLLSIFFGAIVGSKTVSRTQRVLPVFILLQYFVILLPSLQILIIRNMRLFLSVTPGEFIAFTPMLGAILAILFPFSFFVGMLFPYAVTIYPAVSKSPAKGIGAVYIYESLGSMLGGAALTFYLIIYFTPYQIIALFAFLMLINTLLLTRRISGNVLRPILLVFWMGINGLWIGATYFQCWSRIESTTIQQRWETIHPQIELVESTNSRYENIAIARMSEQYSIYGNGQYYTSFPDPYQSELHAHFILSQHPKPDSVLLIGGGISGLLGEILKHPVKSLHYVELDAELITVAQKYLPAPYKEALTDSRVSIFLSDGRHYVKQCSHRYDLVIVRMPEPSTAMLNRFYTVDFFQEVAEILNPNGLLVTGSSSSENYLGPEIEKYTGSIYHSLKSVFDHVLVTPGDFNYFFASFKPDIATTDLETLATRYLKRRIDSSHFSPHHFHLFLEPERVASIQEAIKDFPIPYLNTDAHPVTYFYSLILWEFFSGGKGETLFNTLSQFSWEWYVGCLLLVFVLRFAFVSLRRNRPLSRELRFSCLYAICSTGFAGMGLEMILLFAYQSTYGYLYQRIGIIIALFMAGLAGGAYLMTRFLPRSIFTAHKVLLSIEAGIVIFCILLSVALTAGLVWQSSSTVFGEFLFMALVLGAGILTGAEFPLVNEMLIQAGFTPGRSAGVVDGFDHLGACMGAALTGTFLVPLLGITQASLLIGMLKLLSCLFLTLLLIKNRKTAFV